MEGYLLNKSGIKTNKGKKWLHSSVTSVFKRRHEHDLRIKKIRSQHFPTKSQRWQSITVLFFRVYSKGLNMKKTTLNTISWFDMDNLLHIRMKDFGNTWIPRER